MELFHIIAIVSLLVVEIQSAMSMLGDNVSHPLFFWGPEHLMAMLQSNRTGVHNCLISAGKFTSLWGCVVDMAEVAEEEGIPRIDSLCRSMESFPQCFHKVSQDIADDCEIEHEDRKLIDDAVKNHEEIYKTLCDDDAKDMIQYFVHAGMECSEEKEDEILGCHEQAKISGKPKYDAEGCMAAYNFAECASLHIGECSDKAGEILKKVMRNSLKEPCRPVMKLKPQYHLVDDVASSTYRSLPNGSLRCTSVIFFHLILTFFSGNFHR